ncbi:MAG: aminotransferase class V-fold PLP-dependent enzyme [Bacillota bacterium]
MADAMRPFLSDYYGNPSSGHWAGVPAKEAYENARTQVAKLLDCKPSEIVFTSGGSEANNYAIKGVYYALRGKGNHIITTQIEHPAVSKPCDFLRKQGAVISYVGVDSDGQVSPEEIEQLITDSTILISVMHANNETGVIQPIKEISRIAKKHNIAYSGAKRPPVPEETDHRFRRKSTSHSGLKRPLIPEKTDHFW